MNACRNGFSRLVGMEIHEPSKYLKTLERVKGIEPSYSAWKAAALPLSYTRVGDHLTRQAGSLNYPRNRGETAGYTTIGCRFRPKSAPFRP